MDSLLRYLSAIDLLKSLALVWLVNIPALAWAQIQYPQPRVVEGTPTPYGGYVQPDGKLIVGGAFEGTGDAARRGIARLNQNGTLDTSFAIEHDGFITDVCGLGNRVFILGSFAVMNGISMTKAGYAEYDIATGQVSPGPASSARYSLSFCNVAQNVLYLMGNATAAADAVSRVELTTNTALPALPAPNGFVYAVQPNGSTLFVGGSFNEVAGQPRLGFAAIDLATNTLLPYNLNLVAPSVTTRAQVFDIKIASTSLYVAGLFGGQGVQTRRNLAEFDLATGVVTSWRPEPNSFVNSIVVTSDSVYALGSFSTVNGSLLRNGAAAINRSTGAATNWNPSLRNGNTGGAGNRILPAANNYYLLGTFNTVGGESYAGVASVFAVGAGGRSQATASLSSTGTIRVAAFDGSGWWVGGSFRAIDGVTRANLARLNLDGSVDTSTQFDTDGVVTSLHVAADRIYVGGTFRQIGNTTRSCIAPIKLSTRQVEPWLSLTLSVNCAGPTAITSSGDDVYVGGAVSDGSNVRTVYRVSSSTGAFKPFQVLDGYRGASSQIAPNALAVSGNTLFIGGNFTRIESVQRTGIAAVDAITGQVKSFNPVLENGTDAGSVSSLAVVGDRLLVAGPFGKVNGIIAPNLVGFKLSDLTQLPTQYFQTQNAVSFTPAIAVSETGREVYYCAATSNFAESVGAPRELCAAFDIQSGVRLPWRTAGRFSTSVINGIAVGGGRVLYGSSMTERDRADGNRGIKMVGAAQRPASIRAVSGSGQSASLSNNFAPLVVDLIDEAGNAIPNAYLKAFGPGSGAAATFANPNGFVITDASGRATIATRANGSAGSYTVNVITDGTSASASFSLTNTAGCSSVPGDCDGDGVPDSVEPGDGLNAQVKDNDVFAANEAGARLFVKQVYRDFLGREADAGGLGFWAAEISAGRQTRASMIEQFINGGEFQANVAPMARLYFGTYLRIPDYGGLLFWTGEYQSRRRTLTDIATAFATAPEFVARYGNPTNRNYVNLLYQNIIGRAADQAGSDFWTSQLDSGASTRGAMLAAFTESNEYKAVRAPEIFTTLQYAAMLKREPNQTEFDNLTTRLRNNTLTPQVSVSNTITSAEYRSRFLP